MRAILLFIIMIILLSISSKLDRIIENQEAVNLITENVSE